ncbi:MAG: hemerythrin domain-containing protein, partial [Bacteroidales bacterium]|nr:hemerythrin domain-containing protein [Bacteroidales bacterium]
CYTNDILNIVNYLKNCHTYYLNEKYPQIREYIQQIHTLNNHPEMVMIHDFFDTYFNEVKEHLVYENEVVFPYVLYLLNKNKCTDTPANYSVTEYREHHNDIEEKLYDLKNLLVKYLPIKDDQQIRRKLLFSLYELEYDLKIHSHIEIFLLIPLAEKIEQTHNKINE